VITYCDHCGDVAQRVAQTNDSIQILNDLNISKISLNLFVYMFSKIEIDTRKASCKEMEAAVFDEEDLAFRNGSDLADYC
jgi:hypothetical protein